MTKGFQNLLKEDLLLYFLKPLTSLQIRLHEGVFLEIGVKRWIC